MTRRLIVMRHAKSSWDHPGLRDHDRPLNGRGRRSAAALGRWLRDEGYLPDQILSSTSARTRETCLRLGLDAPADYLPALYHAAPSDMFGALRGSTGQCVLMLGHNPGIAGFAEALMAVPPDHPRFPDYPTCATLVADFDLSDWRDLEPGTGRAVAFVIPRELAP